MPWIQGAASQIADSGSDRNDQEIGESHEKTTSVVYGCGRPRYRDGDQRRHIERSKRVRSGRYSEFQGRHSSAFEVALLLVPRTGRRWL